MKLIFSHGRYGDDMDLEKNDKTYYYDHMEKTATNTTLIHEYLFRSEIELFNTNAKINYRHKTIYFEFTDWSAEALPSLENVYNFISAVCLVRKENGPEKDSITVLIHDSKGGISGAAIFLALYNLLQRVDEEVDSFDAECVTPHDMLRASDIFQLVINLRKKRSTMIHTYSDYLFLFHCLNYYGQNKTVFDKLVPTNVPGTVAANNEARESTIQSTLTEGMYFSKCGVRQSEDDSGFQERWDTHVRKLRIPVKSIAGPNDGLSERIIEAPFYVNTGGDLESGDGTYGTNDGTRERMVVDYPTLDNADSRQQSEDYVYVNKN